MPQAGETFSVEPDNASSASNSVAQNDQQSLASDHSSVAKRLKKISRIFGKPRKGSKYSSQTNEKKRDKKKEKKEKKKEKKNKKKNSGGRPPRPPTASESNNAECTETDGEGMLPAEAETRDAPPASSGEEKRLLMIPILPEADNIIEKANKKNKKDKKDKKGSGSQTEECPHTPTNGSSLPPQSFKTPNQQEQSPAPLKRQQADAPAKAKSLAPLDTDQLQQVASIHTKPTETKKNSSPRKNGKKSPRKASKKKSHPTQGTSNGQPTFFGISCCTYEEFWKTLFFDEDLPEPKDAHDATYVCARQAVSACAPHVAQVATACAPTNRFRCNGDDDAADSVADDSFRTDGSFTETKKKQQEKGDDECNSMTTDEPTLATNNEPMTGSYATGSLATGSFADTQDQSLNTMEPKGPEPVQLLPTVIGTLAEEDEAAVAPEVQSPTKAWDARTCVSAPPHAPVPSTPAPFAQAPVPTTAPAPATPKPTHDDAVIVETVQTPEQTPPQQGSVTALTPASSASGTYIPNIDVGSPTGPPPPAKEENTQAPAQVAPAHGKPPLPAVERRALVKEVQRLVEEIQAEPESVTEDYTYTELQSVSEYEDQGFLILSKQPTCSHLTNEEDYTEISDSRVSHSIATTRDAAGTIVSQSMASASAAVTNTVGQSVVSAAEPKRSRKSGSSRASKSRSKQASKKKEPEPEPEPEQDEVESASSEDALVSVPDDEESEEEEETEETETETKDDERDAVANKIPSIGSFREAVSSRLKSVRGTATPKAKFVDNSADRMEAQKREMERRKMRSRHAKNKNRRLGSDDVERARLHQDLSMEESVAEQAEIPFVDSKATGHTSFDSMTSEKSLNTMIKNALERADRTIDFVLEQTE